MIYDLMLIKKNCLLPHSLSRQTTEIKNICSEYASNDANVLQKKIYYGHGIYSSEKSVLVIPS